MRQGRPLSGGVRDMISNRLAGRSGNLAQARLEALVEESRKVSESLGHQEAPELGLLYLPIRTASDLAAVREDAANRPDSRFISISSSAAATI